MEKYIFHEVLLLGNKESTHNIVYLFVFVKGVYIKLHSDWSTTRGKRMLFNLSASSRWPGSEVCYNRFVFCMYEFVSI